MYPNFQSGRCLKTMSNVKCAFCDKENLSKDEIGLTKKLIDKNPSKYYCIDCLAEYLGVTAEELYDKIEEFREEGCTLFS